MGVMKLFGVMTAAVLASACTKTINECSSDSDCKDVAYPFCDVNGDFGPSGGAKNVCTIVPPDCPIERCGCSPGATTCTGDTLSVCNADGKSATDTSCSLGCASTNDRCLSFKPSNGLDVAALAADGEADVVLPAMVHIDTDSGEVRDNTNHLVNVTSLIVHQTTGDIRSFVAKSFDISNASIQGSLAAAFVATGKIVIRGAVAANASAALAGPGGAETTCVGMIANSAGGGGGNSTPGGLGITPFLDMGGNLVQLEVAGGAEQTGDALIGGCRGGDKTHGGGGGGGALQVVSFAEIDLLTSGVRGQIHVGGGGGGGNAGGGGAGGFTIFEAPTVAIDGDIYANGGGGAACNNNGHDGTPTTTAAVGGACNVTNYGGSGAIVGAAPGNGSIDAFNNVGGGGALGRVLVRNKGGHPATDAAATISAVMTVEALTPE